MTRSVRMAELDAIRGIAIILVILHNQTSSFPSLHLEHIFANGWMGVDLFFVLSGFLITGILLDSRTSEHYFRNFYARRVLRIWPLYYCAIFLMFVIIPTVRPAEAQVIFARSSPWWAYLLFLQNLLVPSATTAAGLLGVTWSLAVEEQFYLVWPVLVRMFSLNHLCRFAASVICVSPLIRLVLVHSGVYLYSNTLSRLDGLMAGALLAMALRSPRFTPAKFVRPAWIGLLTALPLVFITKANGDDWIAFSLSAMASACFVFVTLFSAQSWLRKLMTNRFIVYTGTISYGLYLLHKLPFDFAKTLHLENHPATAGPLLLIVVWSIAAASFKFLEMPFLKFKRYFPSGAVSSEKIDRVLVTTGSSQ